MATEYIPDEVLHARQISEARVKEILQTWFAVTEFHLVRGLIENRINVYLHGEAGTGKTSLAIDLADYLRRPKFIISCSQWTSPIDIIGGETPSGYREGKLIEAWRYGGILILDELPKLEPNTAGLLNFALAQTGRGEDATITSGAGKVYKKHKDFGVIATGNTNMKDADYRYGANFKQDFSLIDRFSAGYVFIRKNEDFEKKLLEPYISLWEFFDILRDIINKNNINEIVSVRTMLAFKSVIDSQITAIKNNKRPSIEFKIMLSNYLASFSKQDYDLIYKKLRERFRGIDVIGKLKNTDVNLFRTKKSLSELLV